VGSVCVILGGRNVAENVATLYEMDRDKFLHDILESGLVWKEETRAERMRIVMQYVRDAIALRPCGSHGGCPNKLQVDRNERDMWNSLSRTRVARSG
jgi:hypothetical protein